MAADQPFAGLPDSLAASLCGRVAILRLARPHKRNALDDTIVNGIETFFASLPADIRAAVIHGEGEHFPPASTSPS
jgi:enoyl-CoA hydratase/carnithine racemase